MFPEAPIYTFFHDQKFTGQFLPSAKIVPSSLQGFYRTFRQHRLTLPFLPLAAESWDLSDYDLVISSSIAFSKSLILKPKTKHLCYCYSPTRFLWDWRHEYKGWTLALLKHFLRIWDRQAATRVDSFAAISKNVQRRIKKYYGRDSTVIYPPVNSFRQTLDSRPSTLDYFLIVSRLFPHKNVDIAIEAFNKLRWPLLIIGEGPEKRKLERLIENKNLIKIVGGVKDQELASYYLQAKAFIMPQEEDFGLTPLEAMSFGKPVLALRQGGALEYILEEINGEFFDEPHPALLANGARRLNENYKNYSPLVIKKTAERFSRAGFEKEMKVAVNKLRQ